MDGVQEKYEQQ